MQIDIEKKAKTCSACLNAGKNLKFQLPVTEKTKSGTPKKPGEEIQIDFTGNLHNKKLQSSPYILIAVDKNSRGPVAKICKNTSPETVITFLNEYINVYGVPKRIKSDRGGAQNLKRIQRILQIAQHKLRIRHRESTYRNRIGRTNY